MARTLTLARRRLPLTLLLLGCYAAAFAYFSYLSQHPLLAQRLYIDENAWISDGAREGVSDSDVQFLHRVHSALTTAPTTNGILGNWSSIGAETSRYDHRHSVSSVHSGNVTTVLYGAIYTPTGDAKEAIAIVAQYTTASASDRGSMPSGLAYATALINYLARVRWLARNIIIVVVDATDGQSRSSEALSGWLAAYQQSQSVDNAAVRLHRYGRILQSVTLDIPFHSHYDRLSINANGHYGLQPNLDIVAVINHLLRGRGVDVSVSEIDSRSLLSERPEKKKGMRNRLLKSSLPDVVANTLAITLSKLPSSMRGLLRSMLHHVTGEGVGYHGHFIRHNIDAVTIKSLPSLSSPPTSSQSRLPLQVLRSLDLYCRASNNLIEKLHHSTWLYLLLDSSFFITMSKYIYDYALIASPLPIIALTLLMGNDGSNDWQHSSGIVAALYLPPVIGVMTMRGLVDAGQWSGDVSVVVAVAMFGASALTTVAVLSKLSTSESSPALNHSKRLTVVSPYDWLTLKSLIAMLTFTATSLLAVLNFSLALALLTIITPLLTLVAPLPCQSLALWTMGKLAQLSVVALTSPLALLFVYALYWNDTTMGASLGYLAYYWPYIDNLLVYMLPVIYWPVWLVSVIFIFTPCRVVSVSDADGSGENKKTQ